MVLKYSSFLLNYLYLLKVIIYCHFPFKHRECNLSSIRNYSLKGVILLIINLAEKTLTFSDIIKENEEANPFLDSLMKKNGF